MNTFKIILTNNGTNSPHKAPTSETPQFTKAMESRNPMNQEKKEQKNAHPKYSKNGRWSFNFGRIDIRR